MSRINVGSALRSLDLGQHITGYSGVALKAEDANGKKIEYTAGDASGYVLEVSNPTGTQEMANAIYASLSLRGATYQAFQAESVHIDPSFELGDSLTAKDTDAVIWASKMDYGRLMAPALGAPLEEEIDHEAPYKTKQEREFSREKEYTRAQLAITATKIAATVSRTGGNPSSFGWALTDSDWTLYSNGSEVLKATSAGLEVKGKITATSGVIGGVTIQNGVLSGIRGGEVGGNIAQSTLSTWNMGGGINTNLNYGAAYGLATTQGSGSYPNVFNCNNLVQHGRFMSVGGSVCQLLTKTIDGVTITYLGNA